MQLFSIQCVQTWLGQKIITLGHRKYVAQSVMSFDGIFLAFWFLCFSPVCSCRVSEEAFLKECDDDSPGTEWEKVARLCDFNPKTSRQTKDVSRMRSVLISLKQTPLVR